MGMARILTEFWGRRYPASGRTAIPIYPLQLSI
jgi:hypothetical protein